MASDAPTFERPFPLLRWLREYAGFPGTRLPPGAELLLCAAAEAQAADAASGQGLAMRAIERHRPGQQASLRTHALRRAQVHFKCDNSAKV
jgi:hypothetical protein